MLTDTASRAELLNCKLQLIYQIQTLREPQQILPYCLPRVTNKVFIINCRSLFVPYFKYLLESCVRYLTVAGDAKVSGLTKKSKKAKLTGGISTTAEETSLSLGNWQLRALILSSLHKCFLYDTGSLKFLDSSNFQVSNL